MGLAWHLLWSSQRFGYEIQIPLQEIHNTPQRECNHSSRLFADSILTCNSLLLLGCIPQPSVGVFPLIFSLHKHLYILLKVQKMVRGEDCERLFWEPQVPGVLRKRGGRKDVGAQDSLELCFLSLSPLTPATHTFTHSPMVYSPSSGYIKSQDTVSVILELSEIKFLLGILVCCLALKLSSLFSEIPVRRAHKEKQIHMQRFWTCWL